MLVLIDHFYQALHERVRAIRNAKKRIIVESHHLNADRIGILLLAEIIRVKRERPELKVQLLLDYWGSHSVSPELAMLISTHDIEIKYFNYPAIYQFWQLNFRTHRKIFVVDDEVFIGGYNLSEEFFGLHAENNLLDREVLLIGHYANQAVDAIYELWNSPWSCSPSQVLNWNVSWMPWSWKIQDNNALRKMEADTLFQRIANFNTVNFVSGLKSVVPEKFEIDSDQVELIFDSMGDPGRNLSQSRSHLCSEKFYELLLNTKKKAYFESLYFLPTQRLNGQIQQKLFEGIKISVLTNGIDSMDKQSGEILSLSLKYFEELLKSGVELWGIKGRSWPNNKSRLARIGSFFATHAKTYVFDNNIYIGSLNIDPRSFETNLESAVLIKNHRKLASAVRRSIQHRVRKQALPMNSWAQLVRLGKPVGAWTSMKTIKYYALSTMRRLLEPYY